MLPKLYPHLNKLLLLDQTTKGAFANGPRGVTVHYTADRNIERCGKALTQNRLGYHLIIDREGGVVQMTSFDKRVSHAGNAVWAARSPNREHIAIAVVSWGFLTEIEPGLYKSWNGTFVAAKEVAIRACNVGGVVQPWDAATPAQIKSLLDVLHFLIAGGITASDICGHDECALPPGRKLDPGGVLPWPMDALRAQLKAGTLIT